MKTTFTLQIHYRTQWGQRVVVVGNLPEMGAGEVSQGLALQYTAGDNWVGRFSVDQFPQDFAYRYVVLDENEQVIDEEWGEPRVWHVGDQEAHLAQKNRKALRVMLRDSWRGKGHPENALYNAAFLDVLFQPAAVDPDPLPESTRRPLVKFQILAPQLESHQQLCVVGNIPELGNWGADAPLLLGNERYPLWEGAIACIGGLNIEYKYGLYDRNTQEVVHLEDGENRKLPYYAHRGEQLTIVTDNYFQHPAGAWKGAGVALPVFALRSTQGMGIGEFNDLPLLIDWARQTGMNLVQILPINDTTATKTWTDSYPYAAISVFALHPMYVHVPDLYGFDKHGDLGTYEQLKIELNALDSVDYERVNDHKTALAREVFAQVADKFLAKKSFRRFYADNAHWLAPYAYFSYLRDKHGTVNFYEWGEDAAFDESRMQVVNDPAHEDYFELAFYYYMQYHLDKQLQAATAYARKNHIVLKGDIPIGIYRYSVDAWTQPQLYHMDGQAGAPPDPFSATGQNWGFPTYNWPVMAEDGYQWWQQRLQTLSKYFDAFRIDHILGFFRIWQIPYDQVHATLGFFNPAIPVTSYELQTRGIPFDYQRLCKPYLPYDYLANLFGDATQTILATFFEARGEADLWDFRAECRTQRQLDDLLKQPDYAPFGEWRDTLLRLHSNVLFLEDPKHKGQAFHPRFEMHHTESFQRLPQWLQERLYALYFDYFYDRQNDFWAAAALEKLPALQSATDMLICGEDLGMIPDCVPGVMRQLEMLTLEIQRMSKNPATTFLQAADTPYWSVCSPSTHDMSPLRLWWEEEDRSYIQQFYEQELGLVGRAPTQLTPDLAAVIVQQHLDLPSMWAVFPVADLLATSERLRHPVPAAERINEPSNPKHYWRYRLHLNLEGLIDQEDFNDQLAGMVESSGR